MSHEHEHKSCDTPSHTTNPSPQGVPRIKEIINGSKNISTPIIKVKLHNDLKDNAARLTQSKLQRTTLGEVKGGLRRGGGIQCKSTRPGACRGACTQTRHTPCWRPGLHHVPNFPQLCQVTRRIAIVLNPAIEGRIPTHAGNACVEVVLDAALLEVGGSHGCSLGRWVSRLAACVPACFTGGAAPHTLLAAPVHPPALLPRHPRAWRASPLLCTPLPPAPPPSFASP